MPSDVYEETSAFLSEYPDTEEALSAVVQQDKQGSWEFDDIPLDSGTFGEFVSRGIAEQSTDGYRLVDRQAVANALNGHLPQDTQSKPSTETRLALAVPDINLTVVGAVVGSLLLVVGFRLFAYQQVFRDGNVVLLGNDPYFYRYWVESLLSSTNGDITLQTLSTFPESVATGEPLLIAALLIVTVLLGGTTTAAGVTLAWYPVVSAVLVGSLIYLLATRLFDDRRIGVAAVCMLAIIPAHGFRSGLGFADHHAFDYPWLAATMLALVVLSDGYELRDWQLWFAVGGLGFASAGQVLAWEAGPLLLLPSAIFLAGRSLSDVRADRSPLRFGGPIVTGLGFGSLLVYFAHEGLNWHTSAVAFAPLLLALSCGGILVLAEVAWRSGLSARVLAVGEVLTLLVGFMLLSRVFPDVIAEFARGGAFLFQTDGIAETTSIISGQLGSIFGPAFLFGFVLFLALPYLGWLSFRIYRDQESSLLVPVVYSWFFLALASVQLRFAGELSIPIAVIAGMGFVHLTGWLDITRGLPDFSQHASSSQTDASAPPVSLTIPGRRTVVLLFATFLLVGSLSFIMTPIKTNQLTIPTEEYQAVTWMDEYATEHGWKYPENYVFSTWGKNRFYNYFVSGESASYGYAKSNYVDFLTSSDGVQWYTKLRDRTGFIILQQSPKGSHYAAESLQTRLHTHYGSESDATPGLSHYRLVYISGDASLTVFTLVPGAQLKGTDEPNSTVSILTTQSVTGQQFTYSRTIKTDSSGEYAVTVPYPGEYTVGDDRVVVSPAAVTENKTVRVPSS